MKRLAFICMMIPILGIPTALAQELTPVFPERDQVVSFFDLAAEDLGFRWDAPPGAANLVLTIRNPFNNPPFIDINVEASPYVPSINFLAWFRPGDYTWRVGGTLPGGAPVSTGEVPFRVVSAQLRPTPTPQVPEPPSGDVNGSASIDAHDIYVLALNWKRQPETGAGTDLNLDGRIDQLDAIAYARRFGEPAVPPTPTPPVGKPLEIRFEPNDVIGFSELQDFRIHWSPPAYPDADGLLYEINIVSQFGTDVFARAFFEGTTLKPPVILTQQGEYTVHIRAKTRDGRMGDIAVANFEVDQNRVVTPTPTPRPLNADLNRDGLIDSNDSIRFAGLFGLNAGDPGFDARADYDSDGVIGRNDLLVFQDIHGGTNRPAAPAWDTILRPLMLPNAVRQCEPEGDPVIAPLDPAEFFFEDRECIFAEIEATRFRFDPVEGALDYYVAIYKQGVSEPLFELFTGGAAAVNGSYLLPFLFPRTTADQTFRIMARAAGEGLQLSEAGAPLFVTIEGLPEDEQNGDILLKTLQN